MRGCVGLVIWCFRGFEVPLLFGGQGNPGKFGHIGILEGAGDSDIPMFTERPAFGARTFWAL